MIDNFAASLKFVLNHECVFPRGDDGDLLHVITENVCGDAGGITKYGIDAKDHPGVNIQALTLDQATGIYRAGEWTACRCDDLPKGLDTSVFDCAVNCGGIVAGILLQRALLPFGFMLSVDGEIGNKTVSAAIAECNLVQGPHDVIEQFLQLRRQRYADIVLHHPADAKFLKGWINRVNDLDAFIFPPAQKP
jgi:lysozyme family protein